MKAAGQGWVEREEGKKSGNLCCARMFRAPMPTPDTRWGAKMRRQLHKAETCRSGTDRSPTPMRLAALMKTPDTSCAAAGQKVSMPFV